MRITKRSVAMSCGVGLFVACVLVLGCGGSKPADEPVVSAPVAQPVQAPAAEPAAPLPGELPPPAPGNPSSINDAKFTLSLAPVGEYKAGQLSSLVVQLDAKGQYHINKEYPISIALSSHKPELSLPKAQLERPDAATFDDKQARFEVPFTPGVAGAHAVMAQVKFAVCTDENCWEDARNLAIALAVN
jgi:hypothetical protein